MIAVSDRTTGYWEVAVERPGVTGVASEPEL